MNPAAGRRSPDHVEEAVRHSFARRGITATIDVALPRTSDDATVTCARGGAGGTTIVAAVGGDGTVRDVAAGLAGSATPLAIIPNGTANVLASDLGIPMRPADAADLLREGAYTAPLDLGDVNGEPFVLNVGAGYAARLILDTPHSWKRRVGFFAYLPAAVRATFARDRAQTTIIVDGMRLRGAGADDLRRQQRRHRRAGDSDRGGRALRRRALHRRRLRAALADRHADRLRATRRAALVPHPRRALLGGRGRSASPATRRCRCRWMATAWAGRPSRSRMRPAALRVIVPEPVRMSAARRFPGCTTRSPRRTGRRRRGGPPNRRSRSASARSSCRIRPGSRSPAPSPTSRRRARSIRPRCSRAADRDESRTSCGPPARSARRRGGWRPSAAT